MADLPLSPLILTPAEMGLADKAAAASGLPSFQLMQRAGEAVAAAALRHHPGALRFVVLAGPGNNGGDGYVAGAALAGAGAVTVLHAHGDPARLTGDAATARDGWRGEILPLADYRPKAGDVVIDAVFGTGLSRDVPAELADIIVAVERLRIPVVAVDIPSGIDGLTGRVRGAAFRAERTVTFMTRKPGHLLLPGREHAGIVEMFDIGIPARIVASVAGPLRLNGPWVWQAAVPRPGAGDHKYRKGHLAVFSGPAGKTGAARLAARAGLRAGAGLVTIAAPPAALAEHAAQLSAIMLRAVEGEADLSAWFADPRIHAVVIGPGFGQLDKLRSFFPQLVSRAVVLDADGLTAFADHGARLFEREGARGPLVLTPHEGEFARLFPDLAADSAFGKVERARAAARRADAVILYKGADTVIAAPDGRAVIAADAPPTLATAGSGDVLAGTIGGLLAQGMPPFEAAALGAHLHAEAALALGPGLTADTLCEAIRPAGIAVTRAGSGAASPHSPAPDRRSTPPAR